MASQPIILQHRQFSSKKDATEFFKNMLDSYNDGDIISSVDDDNLLFDLIQRHPEVETKIGVGIENFYRVKSQNHPTSCFHIKRTDGSTTDFSYSSCIKSSSPTLSQDFYSACRYAVSEKLINEKNEIFSNGEVNCSITGDIVTKDSSEYRHTNPRFRDIVNNFKIQEELDITPDMIVPNDDMQYATAFANQELATKFNDFHTECANLEIVKKFVRR